jgi:ABC-type lipoprotein export system ATPase subunit
MSFSIKKGDFVCIIGDIGSGKSSVMNSLIGDLLYIEKDFYSKFKNVEINDYLTERICQLSQETIPTSRTPIVFNQSYGNPKGIAAYAP